MNYVIALAVSVASIIWYIRPIYNFLAKRKYLLLDTKSLSLSRKLQTWLPSLIFFALIFALMFLPALTGDLISKFEIGSIFVLQIVFIFFVTRFDKFQTKYKVTDEGLKFRFKTIRWDEPYTVKFKRNSLLILHKPRFIIKSETKRIVVPMLSFNFELFAKTIASKNHDAGAYVKQLYKNTRAYYVENLEIEKELNKNSKKAA